MSATEIIAELANLSRPELERVDLRLHTLLESKPDASSTVWGQALLEVAGTARGLPEDFARNHDHYLHGASRR